MTESNPDKLTGWRKMSSRFGIYRKILILSLVISMAPILLLGIYTAITMNNAKTDIVSEIETAFDSKERVSIELLAYLSPIRSVTFLNSGSLIFQTSLR
jgi:hypothetical protein